MKKKLLAMIFALCIVMITGCGAESQNGNGSALLNEESEGNLTAIVEEQNNMKNKSSFCTDNGWIYGQYRDDYGNSIFVKTREDYSDWTVLDKGYATQIKVKDGYIYYMKIYSENKKDDGIYRMRMSGEGKEKLCSADGMMQLKGDAIYYSDEIEEGTDKDSYLRKMDLNGKNKTVVMNQPVFYWYVFDDGNVIYQNDADNETVHIYNLNTKEDIKVNNDITYCPIYDGEYIYYVKSEISTKDITNDKLADKFLKSNQICRMRPDGSDESVLVDGGVEADFILYDKYIYYINENDGGRVYRVDKNGENRFMISQDERCTKLGQFGSKIKYTVYSENGLISNNSFCEFDGSNRQIFEK